MSLLEFLQNNISSHNTADEIINVFEEMCKTPIEKDLLLLEYGVLILRVRSYFTMIW